MRKSALSAKHFHDEQAAFDHIEGLLWPNGPVCPHCGGEGYAMKVIGKASVRKDGTVKPAPIRIGVKKCRACQVQFTVRVGTIFEESRAPLHLWLQAIALLASSKKGISSNQLSRMLGVTLKTAWFMSHRIRMAMAPGSKLPPMGGAGRVVEIDETYHGKVAEPTELRTDGKKLKQVRKGKFAGPANKRAIIALVERGGSARTFHVAEANAATVQKIVRENVHPQSRVHTDASSLYQFAAKEFAEHQSVRHSMGEYVKWDENGAIHNNSCESYFSVFKRGMKGVYQHCSEKHLHRYLAEFDYRHNNRTALGVDDEQRAETVIAQVVGKRLTYKAADRPA
jgi:transposase-like protein